MTVKDVALPKWSLSPNTQVKATLQTVVKVVIALVGFGFTVQAYHTKAVAAITKSQEDGLAKLRADQEERLKQYPTWAQIRELREADLKEQKHEHDEDQKYLDSRLEQLRRDLTWEIRRSR